MKKLTILVDFDDTLNNLCDVWVGFLNKAYGTDVNKYDIKCWDITKAFPSIAKDKVYEPLFNEEMWKCVAPVDGAVKYLKQIIDDGHKVVIVTASHQNTVAMKLNNVLFKHFPFLTYNDVIITSQKQLIKGDILIDDAPHNHEGGDYFSILVSAPNIEAYKIENNGWARADTWEQIYKIVCEYAER